MCSASEHAMDRREGALHVLNRIALMGADKRRAAIAAEARPVKRTC